MLKILQICNKAPYPANDGSSIAILNMARGLAANGVEMHVLAINTKKNFKPDHAVPPELRERLHYKSVFRNTNVSVMGAVLNLFSGTSYFVSRFRFRRFAQALKESLTNDPFDIVQLEGLFMAVYIPYIKKLTDARIVLRAHNIEHVIWDRHIRQERFLLKKWYLVLQNRRLRKFELRTFNNVDAIVPITSADEAFIRKLGCKKPVFTCITGIVADEYKKLPSVTEKKLTVFYFGSMDWLPNQEAVTWFLDNCWEKVRTAVPTAKFVIAGRGMPLHFFHINRPGVTIIEEVESPQEFYQTYQVMVVPLWSGSGLRIKIVEGMASAKAIVSTSIGAEGINCTHGGNILIADSAEHFSQAVIGLLQDNGLRDKIAAGAATLAAREFNNNVVVGRLVKFYGTLS